jgi:hypothetical protein
LPGAPQIDLQKRYLFIAKEQPQNLENRINIQILKHPKAASKSLSAIIARLNGSGQHGTGLAPWPVRPISGPGHQAFNCILSKQLFE